MSSQTAMPYLPALGITRPPAVIDAGLAGILDEAAADADRLFADLSGPAPAAAPYALLNAHRRRVLVTMTLRELYHVSRLREDSHSQWDIRDVAGQMSRVGREAFPLCARLLGGKDAMEAVLPQKL